MKNFKLLKVFDCQEMPQDVRKSLFFFTKDPLIPNGVYVEWTIHESTDPCEEQKLLDAWLIENGAIGAPNEGESGEKVLIKHWW